MVVIGFVMGCVYLVMEFIKRYGWLDLLAGLFILISCYVLMRFTNEVFKKYGK